jgi:alanyl-tRNA synthetase
MTKRCYYDDSYTMQFSAQILERLQFGTHPAVILDKTYFYPTSGGQPCDTGLLNASTVTDVTVREADGAVIHVLASPIEADEVMGQINWSRRLDHMQHHTGQHILTQSFVQIAGAKTVGFHLSADSVTIDLDRITIPSDQIDATEDLANRIIFENRPVAAQLREMDDQEGVRIRRLPRHLLTEGLRVIEIKDFDRTACGGTHVSHTGEIGCIKILKMEKRGDKTRVEFRCGTRALTDYREKNRIANILTALLNCRLIEVPENIDRQRDELKQTQTALKQASNLLLDQEAVALHTNAEGIPPVVMTVFEDRDINELRLLATKITANSDVLVLLGSAGAKSSFCFARGEAQPHHMGELLKAVLQTFGGRGGGQPNLAQGGGFPASREQVETALRTARDRIGHA